MKIYHIALISLLLMAGIFPAISQERPGCFQRKPSGEYESLDHLCPRPVPPSPAATPPPPPPPPPEIGFNPQKIEGLELSALRLEHEGSQRFLVGYITNKTGGDVTVSSIDIQFVGIHNNIVITAKTFEMNNTRLRRGQSREFRETLSDVMELGRRGNDELKIDFTGWR